MASIRRRKDTKSKRWLVDYRDASGKRRTINCKSRDAAELTKREKESEPGTDPNLTFAEMSTRWLNITKTTVRPQTLKQYETILRIHILPELGHLKIARVEVDLVMEFLANKLNGGLSPKTVGRLQSAIYSVFRFSMRVRVVRHNPALGLGADLKLRRLSRKGDVKPFTDEELWRLLDEARSVKPGRTANLAAGAGRDYPLLFTMAQTGLRIGEANALEWPDLDFAKRHIRVERQLVGSRVDSYLKTNSSKRRVDMSADLCSLLKELRRERMEKERLRYGWTELPPWVFCGRHGKPLLARNVADRFKSILDSAGLPRYHTPHDLRHTYACRHLQLGTNPVYVQKQLGHASIQTTWDIYGRWFPVSDLKAADRLDEGLNGRQGSLEL